MSSGFAPATRIASVGSSLNVKADQLRSGALTPAGSPVAKLPESPVPRRSVPPPPPRREGSKSRPLAPPRKRSVSIISSNSSANRSDRSGSRSSHGLSRTTSGRQSRVTTLWKWVRGLVLDGSIRRRFAPPDSKHVWKVAAALLECEWTPPDADACKRLVHAANKAVSTNRAEVNLAGASSPRAVSRQSESRVLTRVGTFRRSKGARSSLLPSLHEF